MSSWRPICFSKDETSPSALWLSIHRPSGSTHAPTSAPEDGTSLAETRVGAAVADASRGPNVVRTASAAIAIAAGRLARRVVRPVIVTTPCCSFRHLAEWGQHATFSSAPAPRFGSSAARSGPDALRPRLPAGLPVRWVPVLGPAIGGGGTVL